MKKLLALVLALVMTLSLCTVSNAAYSDAADVDYKEAVDVMSAIGVLQGSDGKFNPDGILTREQAAKIVTYMLLGQKAADALVTIAAPFADVAADRWSAGSIAYCYNEGILAGVGEGKFDPAGQLTGLAFAKMMLTALGYDAEQEGLTGSNWSINVAKMALSLKLTDGMEEVVLSQPMSRQQAAQMALNVLETMTVKYPNTSTITAGDVTIKTNTTYQDDGVFMGKYWSKLKVNHGDSTDFKAPATTWSYKNEEIGTYADKADETFVGEVTYGQLYSAIGSTALNNLLTLTVYVDGYKVADNATAGTAGNRVKAANITKGSDTKFGYDAATTWAADDTYPTGNGVKTEVFVDEDSATAGKYNVQVNIVNTYIGKVNKVNAETAKADRNVQITNKSAAMTLADSGKFETEEFAKDDYVLFTATYNNTNNNYTIQSAELVEKVAAKEVTSKKGTTSFVADGTTYKYAKTAAANYVSVGDTYDLYLDNDGFVAYFELYNGAVDLSNYLVVIADDTSTTLGSTKITANAVTLDGKWLGGITLGKLDGTKINAKHDSAAAGAVKVALYTVYSFSVDSESGKYNLKPVATPYTQSTYDMAGTNDAYSTGASSYNGTTVNSATKFVVYNSDKDTVKVYDGIKNMVNVADDKMTGACSLVKSSKAVAVFMEVTATTSNNSSAKDLIYILDDEFSASKDGDDTVYTYSAIVNGKVTTISTKDTGAGTNDVAAVIAGGQEGLYFVTYYDGAYVANDSMKVAGNTAGTNAPSNTVCNKYTLTGATTDDVTFGDDVLVLGTSKTAVIDANCAVWSITDEGEATEITAEDLVMDDSSYTYWVVEKTTDSVTTATMIFLQK